ncbi:hypothetical protein I4U23_010601 [Adineta vaga]|nr:hypothetical protein I4U23_010601 [Adineta vaga]
MYEQMLIQSLCIINYEKYLHLSNEVSTIRPNRLTLNEIACARQIRLRELQILSIIREIFLYISFVTLVSVVVYSNENENVSFQLQHLRKSFHQLKVCFFQICRMLFETILVKFDSNQLSRTDSFFSPFTLTLFVLIVVFICLNLRKRTEWELQEERDKKMRGEFLYTMDTLPLKTKQLVNQLN